MNTWRIMIRFFLVAFALTSAAAGPQAADQLLPAFPGAEGFGAYTPGGRGGRVILVTNLNDDGPGSLRAACETKGPRIVVFQVGGIIELQSTLVISEPYITVAGQTAPGDGICIKDYQCVVRNTHDVIIRHLRFRPGDGMGIEQDVLAVYVSQNVIIDHCSTSWGTDETLSVTGAGADNITVQWCLITESLNNSVHSKGEHGYGSLLRADGNLTFHHNLYASHKSRNPRPGTYGDESRGLFLDFRNNVIYNWGAQPGYSAADKVSMNYVANYLKAGPATPTSREYAFSVGGPRTTLFVDRNELEGHEAQDHDNWQLIVLPEGLTIYDVRIPVPLQAAPVQTDPAGVAYRRVLAEAGATLPRRDAVDSRIVEQVRKGEGAIIDSQQDVGSWPRYRRGKAPRDSDSDGMPDAWEKKFNLDPQNAADSALDRDGDGYTNIEEFINGTDPVR